MEELYKALDEVINSITESDEYKTCIELKDRMSKNINITDKINKIKKLQKEYVKSNYDFNIKIKLDELNNELISIPIYKIYMDNLEIVNEKIDYLKDSLSNYFYKLFNE